MITLSTSSVIDGGLGASSPGQGCGADASNFSSVLAGASSPPIISRYTPAVELSAPLPTDPPALSEAPTAAALPGNVGADLFPGVARDAAVGAEATLMTSPESSSTQEEPFSNHRLADGLVTTTEMSAAAQQIVQAPGHLANKQSGVGASGEHSADATVSAMAAMATRSPTLAVARRPSAAAPSGSEKTEENDGADSDELALPIQQVLAAAASLTGSVVPPPVQQEIKQQGAQGSAIGIEARFAPSLPQDQGSADLAAELQDRKLAGSVVHGLSILPSQDPAMIVGQHGPTVAHIDRVMMTSSAIPSAAQALDAAGNSQTADLHQLDALVREIAEVSGNTGRAALRLTADQLGPLEIRLHRSDAGMNVTIRTDNEQSHAAMAQAQQQLSDDMRANGLKVAATSVTLGHGGADRDQRDRQHFTFSPPIEAATASSKQSEAKDDQQPSGRFA